MRRYSAVSLTVISSGGAVSAIRGVVVSLGWGYWKMDRESNLRIIEATI
jgi:hypothetical protein